MRKTLLVLVAVFAVTATALAAGKNGIQPLTPKNGARFALGTRPTFTGKVTRQETVFIFVSKSKKRNNDGVIAFDAAIQKTKPKLDGAFKEKADYFNFPEFWLNTPGTYYWQAHQIACENGDTSDCLQEGPVIRFKVG